MKSIFAQVLQIDELIVQPNASIFADLGADSLDLIDLTIEIEKAFNISLHDEFGPYDLIRSGFRTGVDTYGQAIEKYIKLFPREAMKIIESRVICFRFNKKGIIEAALKFEDGSWCYADGMSVLPSSICFLAFSKWSNVLKELEDIINDPDSKEANLQKFFETYPELIAGNDYDVILPQAVIVNDNDNLWKSDFVLTPKNQREFAKILELKIPSLKITTRPHSGHVTFSAKIWHAIQQVRDYSRAFDSYSVREKFKNTYGVDVFKPDLHLIAGRKWDIQLLDSIRSLQRETAVKIEDWDTALERLKRNYT